MKNVLKWPFGDFNKCDRLVYLFIFSRSSETYFQILKTINLTYIDGDIWMNTWNKFLAIYINLSSLSSSSSQNISEEQR